ncbi:Asp23/Gls24 family envelope stress response protein [Megasphaera hominis]|jgi:uncharacterized alkaline shock family protein YloU|uniref:Asp23/Gls24 family envelope stress response protein n=1 Tax=Megasphaera hominis TaxID=159836 RepID=A0ABR6VGT7_9FIRM|nr:Asp23/Gls24 family envelope stress response protein [Megasphaera hominis]MBC3536411.1 Asp23/Gls24 family envelope stress response protein [Megasphaera hominis]
MKCIGFIGPSGTGKSHHALVVAHDYNIDCIIDDGLLIYHNKIVVGHSAKEENNRMQAVRRAIFFYPDHAASVRQALAKIAPDQLLILGTSKHMIHRICEALHLPEANQFIHIEDVSSAAEIAKAREIRNKEGKHIIPVPTMELKSHFHGYLLDPIRALLRGKGGKKEGDVEQSVVRPVFSYYGKLVFSDDVLFAIVRHCLSQIKGIARVNRVKVAKNYETDHNGLAIILTITVYYGESLKQLMRTIKDQVQHDIEYMTGMSVDVMKITVRGIATK